MRTRRFTFKNAFHHVMNRALNGTNIFKKNEDKDFFLSLLQSKSRLYKIRIFAYCIMDNHYHIILKNSSNKMSDFMRQLNSEYALYFRKKYGGRGYVFQDRFKSTLIQDDSYLFTAILYTLLNPVRAKIVENPIYYRYSSINEYFNNEISNKITNSEYIEELFMTKNNFVNSFIEVPNIKEIEQNSNFGKVIGDNEYIEEIKKKVNTREKSTQAHPNLRERDYEYIGVGAVINVFEKMIKSKIEEIDVRTLYGKRLRLKLLKMLREEAGLKYREINVISIFKKLKFYSLSHLYKISISY